MAGSGTRRKRTIGVPSGDVGVDQQRRKHGSTYGTGRVTTRKSPVAAVQPAPASPPVATPAADAAPSQPRAHQRHPLLARQHALRPAQSAVACRVLVVWRKAQAGPGTPLLLGGRGEEEG